MADMERPIETSFIGPSTKVHSYQEENISSTDLTFTELKGPSRAGYREAHLCNRILKLVQAGNGIKKVSKQLNLPQEDVSEIFDILISVVKDPLTRVLLTRSRRTPDAYQARSDFLKSEVIPRLEKGLSVRKIALEYKGRITPETLGLWLHQLLSADELARLNLRRRPERTRVLTMVTFADKVLPKLCRLEPVATIARELGITRQGLWQAIDRYRVRLPRELRESLDRSLPNLKSKKKTTDQLVEECSQS